MILVAALLLFTVFACLLFSSLIIVTKRYVNYFKVTHSSAIASIILLQAINTFYLFAGRIYSAIVITAVLISCVISYKIGKNFNLIGITGQMGSGKSTILKKVKKSGIKVIDCDYEIHQIINSNKNFHLFLKDLFVNLDYCDKAGIPDRQKIATIIFDTNINLKNKYLFQLYKLLTLRLFQKLFKVFIVKQKNLCVIEGSHLLNSFFFRHFTSLLVCIYVSNETDLMVRIQKRNPEIPLCQLQERMKHQLPLKRLLSKCDISIPNSSKDEDLYERFVCKVFES